MPTLTLAQANQIVAKALEKARAMKIKPVTVVVLDEAGHLKAMQRAGLRVEAIPDGSHLEHGRADERSAEVGRVADDCADPSQPRLEHRPRRAGAGRRHSPSTATGRST